MTAPSAGIDIGGTGAKLGVVDAGGRILRSDRIETGAAVTAEELVRRLAECLRRLGGGQPLAGVGVAAPGCRRADGEGVVNVTNLPHIDGFPLRAALEAATGLRTVLDNDANAAAMGEARFGAGRGASRLLVLTVGTGIGGGMVVGGAVHRIAWQGLGDSGHVIVKPGGPRCGCGGHGCVEALASVPAILHRSAELGAPHAAISDLVRAAREGEAAALTALREAGGHLGVALATLTHLLAPDRILLGGGGTDVAGELLLEPLRQTLRAHGQPFFMRGLTVDRAGLGNDAGIVGAAALLAGTASA